MTALALRTRKQLETELTALGASERTVLYRLAVRLTGSAADGGDALQNAWLAAFQAIRAGTFEQRSSMKTWLYRIVVNEALVVLRKRGIPPDALAKAAHVPDANAQADAQTTLRELQDALLLLSEQQRSAFVLKELHGFSARETAQILECSEGAVEQRVMRAREALQARFSHE